MFCSQCGAQLRDDASFCPMCGAATGAGAVTPMPAHRPQASVSAHQPQPQAHYAQPQNAARPNRLVSYSTPLVCAVAYCVLNFFYLNISSTGVDFGCSLVNTLNLGRSASSLWVMTEVIDYAIPVFLIYLIAKCRDTNPKLIALFPALITVLELLYVLMDVVLGGMLNALQIMRFVYFGVFTLLGYFAMLRSDGSAWYFIGAAVLLFIGLLALIVGMPPFADVGVGGTNRYICFFLRIVCMAAAIATFFRAKHEAGELPL